MITLSNRHSCSVKRGHALSQVRVTTLLRLDGRQAIAVGQGQNPMPGLKRIRARGKQMLAKGYKR